MRIKILAWSSRKFVLMKNRLFGVSYINRHFRNNVFRTELIEGWKNFIQALSEWKLYSASWQLVFKPTYPLLFLDQTCNPSLGHHRTNSKAEEKTYLFFFSISITWFAINPNFDTKKDIKQIYINQRMFCLAQVIPNKVLISTNTLDDSRKGLLFIKFWVL